MLPEVRVFNPSNGKRSTTRLKLLVAEDCAEVQERLRLLLERDHDLLGVIAEGQEVVRRACELHPDILLLDIHLPGLNGLVIARRLRDSSAEVKILFVSQQLQRAYVEEAKRIGAAGYVHKNRMRTDLLPAIQAVSEGKLFFPAESS